MPTKPSAPKAAPPSHRLKARRRNAAPQLRLNSREQREKRKIEHRRFTEYGPVRDGLDLDAMSRHDSLDPRHIQPFELIGAYVDWLEARREKPPEAQAKRSNWRKTHTAAALEWQDSWCETGAGWEWRNLPGASAAYLSCNGCVFSFPGPTKPDAALLEVLAVDRQLRERVRALMAWRRAPDVLPDVKTRRADVERHRWKRS